MAFFRKSGPPAVPVDPNAEQFGYVQPPPAGSSFMDQYRYINQTSPSALMQLGAGMIAGDVPQGFSRAAEEMQQGADQQQRAKLALYGFNENRKKENLTRAWLKQRFPDATDAELDAAIANPAILSELMAPPAKRNLITVGDRIYDADTGEWIEPGGTGGGFDLGTGTEAKALEFLVAQGQLTPIEAANVAAGKQITGADGAIYWKTPAGLVRQKPGKQPETVDPNAPEPSPEEKRLTEPKSTETTEQKNARVIAVQSQKAINEQLDNYVELVGKYGVEGVPGKAMDQLNIARQGIMLQMKELYNLGVLNGPDLELMEKMIYDPVVDFAKEGTLLEKLTKGGSQAATAAFGNPKARAKSSADELKKQLDTIVRSKLGDAEKAGNGGWTVEEVQ